MGEISSVDEKHQEKDRRKSSRKLDFEKKKRTLEMKNNVSKSTLDLDMRDHSCN